MANANDIKQPTEEASEPENIFNGIIESGGSSAKPRPTPSGAALRRTVKAKPLVEGINAPAGGAPVPPPGPASTVLPPKITLTNSEKRLITESAASSEAAPAEVPFAAPVREKIELPKHSAGRKAGWSILIVLLAVSVAFGAYLWYTDRSNTGGGDFSTLFQKQPVAATSPALDNGQQVATTTSADSTSTDVNASSSAATVPSTASSTPAAATSTVPALPGKLLKVLNTPTGYLNVRSSPSTAGKIVTQIHPGETYTYLTTQSGWYEIDLPAGAAGWVIGEYVQPVR